MENSINKTRKNCCLVGYVMGALIEDFEALLKEVEKSDYVKYAGILGLNGSLIVSHFPDNIMDMVQSLILYLSAINVHTITAQIRDSNIGISRFQDYFLVIINQGGVYELQKVLESSTKKFQKCLDKIAEKQRETDIKVYSGPLKTPLKQSIPTYEPLLDMSQSEMTVFSIPVRKIFTLEFLSNKISEDLTSKYGEWVVDLFLMIDGEKNIGQITKVLKRDIGEVIMVIEELIKNRAVALKRLKLNNL
jgi:hypothetical protein